MYGKMKKSNIILLQTTPSNVEMLQFLGGVTPKMVEMEAVPIYYTKQKSRSWQMKSAN